MAPDEPTFDMDAAVADLGASLGMDDTEASETERDEAAEPEAEAAPVEAEAAPETEAAPAPEKKAAPESWGAEKAAMWDGLAPEVQEQFLRREEQMKAGFDKIKGDYEFGRSLRDVYAPYRPLLEAAGVNEAQATQYLLEAHRVLATSGPAQKAAYFQTLAKQYGVDLGAEPADRAAPLELRSLQEQVQMLQSTITTREQASLREAQQKVTKEVEAFAGDPANAYFDEVANDIAVILKGSPGISLKEAYDKAVWANPTTRAKEQAKSQTELEKKLRENARLDALKASKAASATIRSRDTGRSPQEPLGSMEETMQSTLAAMRQRAH